MSEKPSPFHKGDYRNGKFSWVLDREHPDLTSTLHCNIDGVFYCAYCCKRCISLQQHLGEWRISGAPPSWAYTITGYTCDCEKAMLERERDKQLSELKKRHTEEERELRKRFAELKPDNVKLCEIKHDKEKKRVERGGGGIINTTSEYYPKYPIGEY